MHNVTIQRGEYKKVTRWSNADIAEVAQADKTGLVASLTVIQRLKKLAIDEAKLTFDSMKALLLI
jgi:hypothetical protein